MSLNYKELGLRCGLEIHQQLSGHKLFCSCSTNIFEKKLLKKIKRKQRAVAGERGYVDIAAKEETDKNNMFTYFFYENEACLVDIDEEPPHEINNNLFDVALSIAKELKLWIPDSIQVMRKNIIDGSVCSSFQRTALVGIGTDKSVLNTKLGHVRLQMLGIEEDACKIIERTETETVYSLSRQGVALVELSTEPDIFSPEQMKETATKIGLFLRSFPNVKRGLGTIRQDVNVSIKGGARVEIKGVQDLRIIDQVVEHEARRQIELIKIKEELKQRKIENLKYKKLDVTSIFSQTEAKLIKNKLNQGGVVIATKIENFKGIFGWVLQPNRRVGSELSDYAKQKIGVGGIFHSDELPKYGITEKEVELIKKELNCESNDGFFLIVSNNRLAELAVNAVILRAKQLITEVPKEVRKANSNGTSSFLRKMPGASRMYPETDVKPLIITKEKLKKIKVPKLIEDKNKELISLGLSKDLAEKLAKSNHYKVFTKIMSHNRTLKSSYVAEILIGSERYIKREFNIDAVHSDEEYFLLFSYLEEKKITKDSINDIIKNVKIITEESLKSYIPLSIDEIKLIIRDTIKIIEKKEFKSIVGPVMKKLKGKADGKIVVELIKKAL